MIWLAAGLAAGHGAAATPIPSLPQPPPLPQLPPLRERYLDYLRRFGKSDLRVLDPVRLRRFEASLDFVALQNDRFVVGKTHFEVGLNEMSDWTEEDFESRFGSAAPNSVGVLNDTVGSSGGGNTTTTTTEEEPPISGSVNWASSDNKLGRAIVPPIRNQGTCGACWSFVAVAAVEASVHLSTPNLSTPLPLSAQELIDCDTTFNRGCQGGNPLYAFEYAMVAGLSGWAEYGYREKVGPCLRKKFPGRAGIGGFTRLAPNDQRALERAVSAGPVAVGICGTDQGFIYYERGVLDNIDCCTTQNHALLIVGYGHDHRLKQDYWLAQNSWGEQWGEKGYVRLLRTANGNATGSGLLGQCGLATSPCSTFGGYLMHPEQEGMFGGELTDPKRGVRAEAAVEFWIANHWRETMLGVSLCLLIASIALLCCDSMSFTKSHRSVAAVTTTTTYQSVELMNEPSNERIVC